MNIQSYPLLGCPQTQSAAVNIPTKGIQSHRKIKQIFGVLKLEEKEKLEQIRLN